MAYKTVNGKLVKVTTAKAIRRYENLIQHFERLSTQRSRATRPAQIPLIA